METKVELYITLTEAIFIKRSIEERNKELIEYIEDCIQQTRSEIEFEQTRQDREIENLKEANKTLLEAIEIYKQKNSEIQDIEIDQFQAELRDMIAKHTPPKRGRPVGSKNKEKANAE
jgi:hypothetical protein